MTMSLTQITTGGVDENINIDSNTLKVDGTNNRVGIGTAAPSRSLDVSGSGVHVSNTGTTGAAFNIIPAANGQDGAELNLSYHSGSGYGPLKFNVGNAERIQIDTSGRLLCGTTSAINSGYTGGSIHLRNAAGGVVVFKRNDGLVTNSLGILEFHSSFGRAASIVVNNEANHTGSSTPGVIVFSTTPSGTFNTPVERLRIASDGRVMIGTSSNNGGFLTVDSGGTQNVVIRDNSIENHKYNGTAEIAINYNGYLNGAGQFRNTRIYNGKAQLIASFDGSTRYLGIGTSSPGNPLHIANQNPSIRLQSNSGSYQGRNTLGQYNNILYLECDNDNAVANSAMAFTVDAQEVMRADSNKNLLIGTSSASPNVEPRLFINTTAESQYNSISVNGNIGSNFGKYFEAKGKSYVRNTSERNIDLVQGINAGSNINVLVKFTIMVVCAVDDRAGEVTGTAGFHRAGGGTTFWTNTPSMNHYKGSGMGNGSLQWVGGSATEKILRYTTDSNRNYVRYIISSLEVAGHDYAPIKIL